MSKPRVSVIIPTFNRGYCLEESIRSVLQQSFADFELIVVDDGSTDNTSELVGQFPAVKLIRLEENRGVSFARNRGMAEAEGGCIAFLDSDDLWEKCKLASQVKWMECHPDLQAVYTDEIWIRNGVRVNPMNKHRKYSGDIFRYCLPLCIVSPSSVLLRAKMLSEVGGFDESMQVCEDYDLWLRICSRYPVLYLQDKLIKKYGGHDDQLSRQYWGMDRFRIRALEKMINDPVLSENDRMATVATAINKARILKKGLMKHGREKEAEKMMKKLAEFENSYD